MTKMFLRCAGCDKLIRACAYDYIPPEAFFLYAKDSTKPFCYPCFEKQCINYLNSNSPLEDFKMQDETKEKCSCCNRDYQTKASINKMIEELSYEIEKLPKARETYLGLHRLKESSFWLNEAFKKMEIP